MWAEPKELGAVNLWAGASPQAGHLAGLPTAASRVPLEVTIQSGSCSGTLVGDQRGLNKRKSEMVSPWAGTSPQARHLADLPTAASGVPLEMTIQSRGCSNGRWNQPT